MSDERESEKWNYDRCTGCDSKHRRVFPNGPRAAKIVLIGEGPGRREDQTGVPFVGPSGQELDQTYLRLAGIRREDIFVTNSVQCRCERGGFDVKPGESLLRTCAQNHLPEELEEVKPELVILCGATACSLLDQKIDLEYEHGIVQAGSLFGWSGAVVPMYHPAAGMHQTSLMTPMLEDWKALGQIFAQGYGLDKYGKTIYGGPNSDGYGLEQYGLGKYGQRNSRSTPAVVYSLISSPKELDSYNIPAARTIGIDTETNEGKPYSIQCATEPGRAFMVMAEDSENISRLAVLLAGHAAADSIVFHNASFDTEICRLLRIPVLHYRDTMQELFHLGNKPQALKRAVYRIFRHRMTSYEDVVLPNSRRVLDDWLYTALDMVTDQRETIPHPVGKGCPTCGKTHRRDVSKPVPHPAERVIQRIVGNENPEYDPWEEPKYAKGERKVRLIGREWLPEVEEKIGRMPRQSIVHAPIDQQIQYACSDADWTLRLAYWLERERERIVKEEWRVAA